MDDDVIIHCENLSKKFCRDLKKSLWYGVQDVVKDLLPIGSNRKRLTLDKVPLRDSEFWALKDISVELKKGESLGLIGKNGAGKTTMLKMLSGLIKPDVGSVRIRGRVGALIALGAGFNPVLTGIENIRINAGILGFSRREIDKKMDEIIDFAAIPEDALKAPVRTYSSGMSARLGFSVAANLDPDILLVDEVLAVGDASFRRKCDSLMYRFRKNGGTLILVTHHTYHITSICTNALWLVDGGVQKSGQSGEVVKEYLEESLVSAKAGNKEELSESEHPITFPSMRAFSPGEEKAFSSSDVCIEIDYRARESFSNLRILINFFTSTGDIRLSTVISDEGSVSKGLDMNEGSGVFSFLLKDCALAPGNYQVRGIIVGREEFSTIASFGWESAPLFFEIYPSGIRSGLATEWGEVVILEGDDFKIGA